MRKLLVSDVGLVLALIALTIVVWLDIKHTEKIVNIMNEQLEVVKQMKLQQREFFGWWEDVVGRGESLGGKELGVTKGGMNPK